MITTDDRAFIRSGGSTSTNTLKLLNDLEDAERVRDAAVRILGQHQYEAWYTGGGPGECRHGRAPGVPCPSCDLEIVNEYVRSLRS